MRAISNLIYYSCMTIYMLFFICSFIVVSNALINIDMTDINFIVGLSITILSFLVLAIILIACIIGVLNFETFITKNQIKEYLTDKFNKRKLPF